MEQCNARLVELLVQQKDELQNLELDARVAKALQLRLEMLVPYMDSWPQALAVAAKPANAGRSLTLLYQLVDDIWAALGDQATDSTWYTKRALVAGAYTATSLYMITDYSPGYRDTWAALRRRVAEGLALEGRLEALVLHTATAASAAATAAAAAAAAGAGARGGAAAGAAEGGAAQAAGDAGAPAADDGREAAAAAAAEAAVGPGAEAGAGQGAASSAGRA
ncbi:hypothetical protein HYH02_015357 [Chlamydomonas schloesseri]|uniref:Ubiquinone biosynthesis protein n=1 Tax=Chlamydomonas schloesseri TaxID=2026947 RepID=A0A835SD02_9CHLO|nr:hypothetical protein HYH02_015357 [Chlamydomonas schloesseri]|eukprot:KAG2423256.1 hypothetical protein HYH02_015357 [Chlamydomonas schloesseri]